MWGGKVNHWNVLGRLNVIINLDQALFNQHQIHFVLVPYTAHDWNIAHSEVVMMQFSSVSFIMAIVYGHNAFSFVK